MFGGFDFLRRQEEKFQRETFERLAPTARAWTPDIKFETPLVIRGETYNQPRLFESEQEYGGWRYLNKKLPRGSWLLTLQGNKRGKIAFTTDVIIPVLMERDTGRVWMSLTPMEIFTCRSGIKTAANLPHLWRQASDDGGVKALSSRLMLERGVAKVLLANKMRREKPPTIRELVAAANKRST